MDKIAFIICSNDEVQLAEADYYIDGLNLPDDMVEEKVYIKDAVSMTSGYNRGLDQTDAKYKVYLHHDVYILNKDFIKEIRDIFRKHPEVGILGVCGATEHSVSGNYLEAFNYGFAAPKHTPNNYLGCSCEKDYKDVVALDGLILVTQYDIRWREDLFTGWDYYDISECMEYRRQGYKCGVVNQEESSPWVYHDTEGINVGQYYQFRDIFTKEYRDFFPYNSDYGIERDNKAAERNQTINDFSKMIENLINAHQADEAVKLMWEYRKTVYGNKRVGSIKKALFIAKKETEEYGYPVLVTNDVATDDILYRLQRLRLAILRVAYRNDMSSFEELLDEESISDLAISWATVFYIQNMTVFMENLSSLFIKRGEQIRFMDFQEKVKGNIDWIIADDPQGRY